MDAVEAHLKYTMHVMLSCVLWKSKECPLSLSPNPKCAAYKVVWKPATPSWKVALSFSPAFSSSTLPPAPSKSLEIHTEFRLSEAYSETVRVTALGLN